METKTLKRNEIEALGKVVSITQPEKVVEEVVTEKTPTQIDKEFINELIENDKNQTINVKPKKRISMKKTTKNTEPRVLKFLANRKPTKTRIIAKALGMNKEVSTNDYKLVANLLLRMHKQGVLQKSKNGVYFIPNEKTQNVSSVKSYNARTLQQRMANMREAKRQKQIERELQLEPPKYNAIDKLENLMRLRKQVGKAPIFYRRIDKQITQLISVMNQGGVQYKEPPFKALNNGKVINVEQKLSGFRLVKNYPNSPYTIGVVVKGSPDLFNYPEFWQPQYQAIEPEMNNEQTGSLKEAFEYMAVAMDLLKKATTK